MNFIELIKKYKIVVPLIQRDYVQGRTKEEKKAKIFLEAIKNGINKGLNLDFIYGTIKDDTFTPIDGQQRLTTLFLIAWYFSLEKDHLPYLENFTYETRSSSKDFIYELTKENNHSDIKKEGVKNSIKNSNWFFLSWERDPTVVAILNMLELIEDTFKTIDNESIDKITYDFLDLGTFKLTDQLYVKMNARGKPLSDFENFKARFLEFNTLAPDEQINLASKLDNDWLDIFWEVSNHKPNEADKLFYNFFYNLSFNFYVEKNKFDSSFIEQKSLLDFYTDVYPNSIENTMSILNNLVTDYKNIEVVFKPFLEVSPSYEERAKFYALSLSYINNFDKTEKLHWIRVTNNLIMNILTQNPDDFHKIIISLKQLSEIVISNDALGKDIYKYLPSDSSKMNFTKKQLEEEKLKITLINNDSLWEDELIEAELHWYLEGQVEFLIKMSNEDIDMFKKYKQKFMTLFDKQKLYSNEKNNIKYQTLIHRALMTLADYLPKLGSISRKKYTFCVYDKALRLKTENWRGVFEQECFKSLLDIIILGKNVETALEKQVNSYVFDSEDYKSYFINPNQDWEIISHAKSYQIKKTEGNVYLNRGGSKDPSNWNWKRISEMYSYYLYELIKHSQYNSEKMYFDESSNHIDDPSCIGFIYAEDKLMWLMYENGHFNLMFPEGQEDTHIRLKYFSFMKHNKDSLIDQMHKICKALAKINSDFNT